MKFVIDIPDTGREKEMMQNYESGSLFDLTIHIALRNAKPLSEYLNKELENQKSVIEELRNVRNEIQNAVDYTNYTKQASIDAHNADIDIINKHINKLKGETE